MEFLHVLKLAAPMMIVIMLPGILANQPNFVKDESLLNTLDHQKASNFKNNEYMRHIHSMMDAYNERLNGKLLIKADALIDTKYQSLKRNGDFINSLLSLPKGLIDAGR